MIGELSKLATWRGLRFINQARIESDVELVGMWNGDGKVCKCNIATTSIFISIYVRASWFVISSRLVTSTKCQYQRKERTEIVIHLELGILPITCILHSKSLIFCITAACTINYINSRCNCDRERCQASFPSMRMQWPESMDWKFFQFSSQVHQDYDLLRWLHIRSVVEYQWALGQVSDRWPSWC